jgi:hypothetical protein
VLSSLNILNFIFFQKANYIFPSFFTYFFCFSYFTFEKNFAGYAYDEYIKEREDDDEAQDIRSPERARGKHRKRSAKLRRSMKKGKMKKGKMKSKRKKR